MRFGDHGIGVVSSVAALTSFIVLLLFATQLLLSLHARTVVASAAHEGARVAATDPASPDARRRGEQQARQLLGAMGASASFDWSRSTDDEVVVRVEVDAPRVIAALRDPASRSTHVERTARVRVERLR